MTITYASEAVNNASEISLSDDSLGVVFGGVSVRFEVKNIRKGRVVRRVDTNLVLPRGEFRNFSLISVVLGQLLSRETFSVNSSHDAVENRAEFYNFNKNKK